MTVRLLTVAVRHEHDVVSARQRARQIAAALGFDVTEQTRIATAVSELARNAFEYARGGAVEYSVESATPPQLLTIRVVDQGPGIAQLDDVLSGEYRSPNGLGVGIVGARRLMDSFDIQSGAGGTAITVRKILPRRAPILTAARLHGIVEQLAALPPGGLLEELQRQNQELVRALDDLRLRQEELERVNRELEDTNRGVVALYAELDERADHLRRADELKTRFLSNMTHEFRTPVNAILALAGLLAERLGSNSSPDHKDELFYIRKSAQQLSDIVDDLLDIAKVEAGKVVVRPAAFEVSALFGALRGMLRPLLVNQSVSLVFDEPHDLPPMFSDESKVSQILRNFISNALKYTERGEVRICARLASSRDAIEFSVADTGIGIPEADIPRVFDEFVQIENPLQRRVKGTGLGLPLSNRLSALLGGSISVRSTLGVGSTFSVTLPLVYHGGHDAPAIVVEPGRQPVLVVEDADEDLLLYDRALNGTRFQMLAARSIAAAVKTLELVTPAAIVLDLRLHGEDSFDLLARVKRDTGIPLLVVSTADERHKCQALGADASAVKPIDRAWLLSTLDSLVPAPAALKVLTVDDEETTRFIIREMLSGPAYEVIEAASGQDGLRLVRERQPDVVLLDLRLTDMSGIEVCEQMRDNPATSRVPVVLVTAQRVQPQEQERLGPAVAVCPKSALTREALRQAIEQARGGRMAETR